MKVIRIFFIAVISISLTGCHEIILHGDISGTVTDAETGEPVQGGLVGLIRSSVMIDSAVTGNDGTYIIENVNPGEYTFRASKKGYYPFIADTDVVEAETREINCVLSRIPYPVISAPALDFGFDLTSASFTVLNTTRARLTLALLQSQQWITIDPSTATIEQNESVTVTVTVDRTGLQASDTIKEYIRFLPFIGLGELYESRINVYLNGVMDQDFNYYRVTKIGSQIWMADNLNVGDCIDAPTYQTNNGKIEKFCYDNLKDNCNVFGGLYQWNEAMQYNPSDTGAIGTTQGICPVGWHIPTKKEWQVLLDTLGVNAGGKLKETGNEHWRPTNLNATNETGFSARAGGNYCTLHSPWWFDHLFNRGLFVCSTLDETGEPYWVVIFYYESFGLGQGNDMDKIRVSNSVRCLKDQ